MHDHEETDATWPAEALPNERRGDGGLAPAKPIGGRVEATAADFAWIAAIGTSPVASACSRKMSPQFTASPAMLAGTPPARVRPWALLSDEPLPGKGSTGLPSLTL
jgi:hypothetical protein